MLASYTSYACFVCFAQTAKTRHRCCVFICRCTVLLGYLGRISGITQTPTTTIRQCLKALARYIVSPSDLEALFFFFEFHSPVRECTPIRANYICRSSPGLPASASLLGFLLRFLFRLFLRDIKERTRFHVNPLDYTKAYHDINSSINTWEGAIPHSTYLMSEHLTRKQFSIPQHNPIAFRWVGFTNAKSLNMSVFDGRALNVDYGLGSRTQLLAAPCY